MIWASADVGSGVYIKSLCCAKTKEKVIALTFDDGPDQEITPQVLDILHKYNLRATFFVIGTKAEKNADILKRMTAENHIIGIHTQNHSWQFPLSSYKAVYEELTECKQVIANCVGKIPRLFRPPFGVTNPRIGRAAKRIGLQCIGWNVRSLDTVDNDNTDKVFERIARKLENGSIVLLHDRLSNAPALLEKIIIETKNRGYKIVALDEMINIKAYED